LTEIQFQELEKLIRLSKEGDDKVKKHFASQTAFELPSVLPMAQPTSQLFYIDAVYQRDLVKYFERDEFYAYDEMLASYLGEHYPSFLIRETV
jgi:hypothetical protein